MSRSKVRAGFTIGELRYIHCLVIHVSLYGPAPQRSSLAGFDPWWNGLSRVERPHSYTVSRYVKDLGRKVPDGFSPHLYIGDPKIRGVGGGYWLGDRPDGKVYVIGHPGVFTRDEAWRSYSRKLCYWGIRPTGEEDANAAQFIRNMDALEGAESLHSSRAEDGNFTLGKALGIF